MAQSSWPFENIDTSETQFSQWARNIGEGVKTGSLNELEVFADSTGMQVKVKSGQAMIRGHYYQNTAEVTLTVTAADLSNPRIDTVLIELDPSANTIVLRVVAGTPGASPTPTALVQTDSGVYQFKLAEVLVATGAITIIAGAVTDGRTYLGAFTGTVPGSAITGEITVATMDGDRLLNNIDTATISSANVTSLNVAAISDLTASATELNYTAGVTSAIQTQLDAKAPLTPAVNAKTANYTLVAGDNGEFITCDGTFTLTIPSATFAAGDRVDFVNIGTGVITFAGSGVTVNSVDAALTIDTQWAGATFFFTSSTAGVLIGRLA
tara:strand:+ start:810 stop:1781 length:972 start_codon:yes stop_codon:yes gene_type:complete